MTREVSLSLTHWDNVTFHQGLGYRHLQVPAIISGSSQVYTRSNPRCAFTPTSACPVVTDACRAKTYDEMRGAAQRHEWEQLA
eukprot:5966845-Prymnesium_polylepis.1